MTPHTNSTGFYNFNNNQDNSSIEGIVEGFENNQDGLYWDTGKTDKNGNAIYKRISGPIRIVSRLYHYTNAVEGVGFKIEFVDMDELPQVIAFPRSDLLDKTSKLYSLLMQYNFYINPRFKDKLLEYLSELNPRNKEYYVDAVGWAGGNIPNAFVLPNNMYSWDKQLKLTFNTKEISKFASKGTLADWQEHVARPCFSHPVQLFALAASLTAPFLRIVGMDSFCLNLYGPSTHGKTTTLQVAASVWGCGSEPDEQSFIYRWNSTKIALEVLAAQHNDALLAIDELGSYKGSDVSTMIYDLLGGAGRNASKSNHTLRGVNHWRTVIMSAGEVSGRHRLEEAGLALAGHLNRFIDISMESGAFSDTAPQKTDDFADQLKAAASEYYGCAGPVLIETLVKFTEGFIDFKSEFVDEWKFSIESLLAVAEQEAVPLNNPLKRTIKRFALVQTVARLAGMSNLFRFYPELPANDQESSEKSRDHMSKAVETVYRTWLQDQRVSQMTDADRMILAVHDYIMANQGKFHDASKTDSNKLPSNLIGYVKKDAGKSKNETRFLLTSQTFKAACSGYAPGAVASVLQKQGFLVNQAVKENRFQTYHNVPTVKGIVKERFYAITENILGEEMKQLSYQRKLSHQPAIAV